MNRITAAVLVLSLFASAAQADGAAATPPAAPHLNANIAPLPAGAPAPFSGILLDDKTFSFYLKTEVALEAANHRIAWRDAAFVQAQAAVETAQERTFMEKHGFTIGLVLGCVGAGLVTYASVAVLRAQAK